MALNTAGLSEYVELHSKEIAAKAVGDAETAALLIANGDVQTNVKGKAPILKMDADATFQDGSSCGRSASGDVTLSDAQIEVAPLKDIQNMCPKSLYNTYYAYALKAGQDPESEGWDAGFADYVMKLRSSKINESVEKLIWQGDKTDGTGNMQYIDGILIQATVANGATDISNSGSDIVAKLQQAFLKMPVAISSKDDFRIFIGKDMYNSYKLALANKNIYQPVDDFTLFGTAAKLQPVSGLNGTNKVVMSRLSNLQLGIDGSDETDNASFKYSQETTNWYMDFYFSVGVKVIYVSETGYASFNSAPSVDAGADQSLTSGTTSTTLSATASDSDGSIASYAWTKTSGTGGTITTASAASTTVTGLTAGTYVFKVTVTDNNGATANDSITVTIAS